MGRAWPLSLLTVLLLPVWSGSLARASLRPDALVGILGAAVRGPVGGTWTVWAGSAGPRLAGAGYKTLPVVRRISMVRSAFRTSSAVALARPLVARGLAPRAALVLTASFRGRPAMGYRRILGGIARAGGRPVLRDVGPSAAFIGALVPGVAPPVDVAGRWMNVLVSFTYDRHHGRTGVRIGTP